MHFLYSFWIKKDVKSLLNSSLEQFNFFLDFLLKLVWSCSWILLDVSGNIQNTIIASLINFIFFWNHIPDWTANLKKMTSVKFKRQKIESIKHLLCKQWWLQDTFLPSPDLEHRLVMPFVEAYPHFYRRNWKALPLFPDDVRPHFWSKRKEELKNILILSAAADLALKREPS